MAADKRHKLDIVQDVALSKSGEGSADRRHLGIPRGITYVGLTNQFPGTPRQPRREGSL